MDLTTLWQEQKTFILCVLGGLLVFFVGQTLISSLYGVEENRRRVSSLRSSLVRTASPARDQLQGARDRNEVLRGRSGTRVNDAGRGSVPAGGLLVLMGVAYSG